MFVEAREPQSSSSLRVSFLAEFPQPSWHTFQCWPPASCCLAAAACYFANATRAAASIAALNLWIGWLPWCTKVFPKKCGELLLQCARGSDQYARR
jgi:hypothetical protein